MSFRVNILKSFKELLSKPPKGRASFGVKQVARTAAVVIRGTESGNWNAKLWSFLQEVGPVVLEFLGSGGIPDLAGFSHLKQVIYMPVRSGS